MGFLALMNAYSMRACLSITIVEMVAPMNHTQQSNKEDTCPVKFNNDSSFPTAKGRYYWTESEQV